MPGKMSLSALLYFAAHPGVSDDDVFARLTRKRRNVSSRSASKNSGKTHVLSKEVERKHPVLRALDQNKAAQDC